MTRHAEQRVLPYTPEQLFDLVAAVDRYPEFLPWCQAARILRREENGFTAEVVIGFKMFRERFTSRVTFDRPNAITVTYVSGPMKHLNNRWAFAPDPGGCRLDFAVDFEFRSLLLQSMIGVVFTEAVRHMVKAFSDRAHVLYGPDGRTAAARTV